MKKFNKASAGFSLLEVMIALTLFSIFITAYMTSEGYNLADSTLLKKELVLQKLCQDKLTEISLNPPQLEESLTLVPKTGNFEEKGYPQYEFSVEWKRLKIPNLGQIEGTDKGGGPGEEEEEEEGREGDEGTERTEGENTPNRASVEKQIFTTMKKNLEDLIWQVKVTVTEKGTDFPFSLATLIPNPQARVQVNF